MNLLLDFPSTLNLLLCDEQFSTPKSVVFVDGIKYWVSFEYFQIQVTNTVEHAENVVKRLMKWHRQLGIIFIIVVNPRINRLLDGLKTPTFNERRRSKRTAAQDDNYY
jgi:hypothetical protein